ncbi:MAG TPA: alpha-amylase family glycosyl hydrolase [Anaerolineales bacterium]
MRLQAEERIRGHLEFLYGEAEAQRLWPLMQSRLASFAQRNPDLQQQVKGPMARMTERDAILITYGDQFQEPGRPPLHTLNDFMVEHLQAAINGIHILPFYPYSSDDGFSVIDYREVDPELGDWDDIARLDDDFRLMFDAVINHISRESQWFQGFLRAEQPYRDYFISVDPETDLSMVVRPRALPLLSEVETAEGERHVWTTFSEDQIDLNFANPQVLLEIVDLLLFYIEKGAEIIRLDAIAYLWKEAGTASIHLPETHHVVKLFRAIMDAIAPEVIFITETNVPHEENISYFGEPLQVGEYPPQGDEAQMVYQFPLAPLVLHTFHTSDARVLAHWAASLKVPYPTVTFFNFIASHDGIGVRPAEGLLSAGEIQALVEATEAHGGKVSYKTNKDGSKSVYELNITLYDFLNDPNHPDQARDVRRFLASQALMLSLAGVPGIYVHSLFGSRNCYACLKETGRSRSINREKFQRGQLEDRLVDPHTITAQVFSGYKRLLQVRREHPAFHPNAGQTIFDLGAALFALKRTSLDEDEQILCLINVTRETQQVSARLDGIGLAHAKTLLDLISGKSYTLEQGGLILELEGYQCVWLTRE